jgi:hypothetical protein
VKIEVDAATEQMKAGMFETELTECQVDVLNKVIGTSKVSQNENVLPRVNQKTLISCLNPRKHKYPEKLKSGKKLCFSNQSSPISLSLMNLHKHLFGIPPAQFYGAEVDCLALLRTTAVLGSDWINWKKNNCYLFSNYKKRLEGSVFCALLCLKYINTSVLK